MMVLTAVNVDWDRENYYCCLSTWNSPKPVKILWPQPLSLQHKLTSISRNRLVQHGFPSPMGARIYRFHFIQTKKKKKRGPLIMERELLLILKDVEKTAKEWETSCETQSSPHTVLCTGVLQLTTEGRDFFFR